jgi:flagellar basal body-associated protein FliL
MPTTEKHNADKAPAPDAAGGKKAAIWSKLSKFFTVRWLVILVLVSIVVHTAGFLYVTARQKPAAETYQPEVSLGAYRFLPTSAAGGNVKLATFDLHISLLNAADRSARERLAATKFRVQQNVEELLRRAHGKDFDDPILGDLKRQLQEEINKTIGLKAISEVIITNLAIERWGATAQSVGETAEKTAPPAKPPG